MAQEKSATHTNADIENADRLTPSQKLYLENTLLRIAGALFRHDGRCSPPAASEIVVTGAAPDSTIIIRPDPRVGQPGPLAHKLFFALIKKHSDYGRPVSGQVSFTKREIMRLIGRKSWGGKDSEELSHALHQIHYTFVSAQFKDGEKWMEHSFNIFPEILIERRELASDPIETCTVMLAEPIIASLKDEHFTCLNHDLMNTLGTIGQALYVRLFFHFANHYDGRNGERLSFQKRYDAICREWLGGLTVRRHASKILGDQLGPHLDRLVAAGFLSSYQLTKARSDYGFVLAFRPGQAFFDDYRRFYRQGRQATPVAGPVRPADVDEPLRLAYLFAEKRTGQPTKSIAFVTTKDKATARELLSELSLANMPAFIDFALKEAEKTGFDVRTLGGIRQYLAPYLAARGQAEGKQRRLATLTAGIRQDDERRAYEAARLVAAGRLFETLPRDQQDAIRMEAAAKAAKFSGNLKAQMTRHHIARITVERQGDRLPSFAEWQRTSKAA